MTLNRIFCAFALLLLTLSPAQAVLIEINTGSEVFDGLLLEGRSTTNVGIIFLHGRGQQPNGDVVRQLRQSLNANGYTTLSIANPVPIGGTSFGNYLSNEATIDNQVFDRVGAAVNELVARNNNIDQVVLGGFSLGSRFATASAAAWQQGLLSGIDGNVELAGLVGVGMYSNITSGSITTTPTPNSPATRDDINVYDTVNNLGLISSIPVLDIYGDLDSHAANFAAARLSAYAGDPLSYTQLALGCPDFITTTYFARNQGLAVPYTENRCHQLRNGFLSEADAENNVAAVELRGSADAPLESSTSAWFADNVPLKPVPVPASLPLLFSGITGLLLLVRRRRNS